MWIHWICISVLIFSVQITIAQGDEEEQAQVDTEEDAESEAQERVERVNLPAGLENVDPKELGLSESDVAKYFGNVKQLQTLNLPGSKAQILTVGFDDNEKLNLQNFEQLPVAGLEGTDKSVAQSAFKQFQSVYGNGTVDLDSLTTLFSKNPKLDVLESLDLIPPSQQQSQSQKVETFQEEEKRVNQHIKEQIEQEERDAHNANLQQQIPYQFVHPNAISQHPIMFLPPPGYAQPHPQQMFYPFPPQAQGIRTQQLIQVAPTPQPFLHPQLRLQQVLEQAKQQQQEMPPVLVQPPVPRRPPPTLTLQARPAQQQFVRVRPFAQTPIPTAQPQIMQIRPAQPQYVQIRQKGEPRQPDQLVQLAQSQFGPVALPQTAYVQLPPHMQQYVTANGQVLHQFQVQPTAAPTAAPMELNYAHQSHPLMIIQNPPELGHTAFVDMYKEYKENSQGPQPEQEHLKDFNQPPSEELSTNSLQGAPAPQFDPSLYAENQQQLVNPQLVHYPVPLSPPTFSTIHKQIPVFARPLLVEQQIQRPFQLQQTERPRPIGTHYRGRHIASIRRPFLGHGPAFGTQAPVVFRGDFRQPHTEPNSYMMAPEPKQPGFGFGSSTPRPPFGMHNINLQTASQQLFPAVLPFMGGGSKIVREPKPSMPMIKISRPENAMRVRKTNKFLEEMVHAFENKLS